MTPNAPFTCAIQVICRLYFALVVFFYMPEPNPDSLSQYHLINICVIVWCHAELIRFAFYTFKGLSDGPLGHLRYNAFLVLQPLGCSTEMICLWDSMNYVNAMLTDQQPYTMLMPNALNWEFRYAWGIYFCFVGFAPGFPFIYSSQLANRKRWYTRRAAELKTA